MAGLVYLVGAGPGNPDLITLRGLTCLRRAEVVLYDRLVPHSLLVETAPACERIYVGKEGGGAHAMTQEAISQLLVERARAGRIVCRLKGGDPFVFGRGGEEAQALHAAGIPFEIVPGVSSGIAAPAFAGIPVTHRGVASSVAFITGHGAAGEVDWTALAGSSGTLVFYMGLGRLTEIRDRLIEHGRAPSTPAAVVQCGTSIRQRVVTGMLADLPQRAAGMMQPALIVVGEVVALRAVLAWAERRPLFGQRILLPWEAARFADVIADWGGEPWLFPRHTDEPAPHEVQILEQELAEGGIHLGVATSPPGVDRLCDALQISLLRRVPFFCGNEETAAALARHGIAVRALPVGLAAGAWSP